jgi:hypothetical protein
MPKLDSGVKRKGKMSNKEGSIVDHSMGSEPVKPKASDDPSRSRNPEDSNESSTSRRMRL